MDSEKERMLAGEPYRADDLHLTAERSRCAQLLAEYDHELDPARREGLLVRLLGAVGSDVEIQPPLRCDYGSNTEVGNGVFANFGLVVLDCAPVRIGAGSQIGPSVQLLAADHPRDPEIRRAGLELARPIVVGNNVWIGGGAILCPGVSVGDHTIIGAGSVVTRDVPEAVVAAGNPCRVIRAL